MKTLLTLFALCFCLSLTAFAQKSDDKEMKAWMEYSTPSEVHKMMATSAGDWKAEVTTYMDPSQPPMKSQAAVHNEMLYDGRYLSTKYTGDMMGMPFRGEGTMAYDNGTKKFYNTWIDNMGTGLMYMTGTISKDGKTLEMKGMGYDPMQGKEVMMREVTTFNGDNEQTMVFFKEVNGREMKVMEIHMTR